MFWERAAVDSYALAFGHLIDERQEFLELKRVRTFEGVRTSGDDKIGVLEGLDGDVLFLAVAAGVLREWEKHLAVHGVTLLARSG